MTHDPQCVLSPAISGWIRVVEDGSNQFLHVQTLLVHLPIDQRFFLCSPAFEDEEDDDGGTDDDATGDDDGVVDVDGDDFFLTYWLWYNSYNL